MKSELKSLATFFIVIIGIIIFIWYRSENAKVKRIEELKEQIAVCEERIEELERENESMAEVMAAYDIY